MAASSTVELDKLKSAFANVHQTMDMIATFKAKALDHMKQTVDVLSSEVEKSKAYLDRVRESEMKEISATAGGNDLQL